MNRRTFLCGLTLGTLATPLAAEGQRATRLPHVGILDPSTEAADNDSPMGRPAGGNKRDRATSMSRPSEFRHGLRVGER